MLASVNKDIEDEKDKYTKLTLEQYKDARQWALIFKCIVAGIVFGVTVVPYFLGTRVGRWLRMNEHGWKIGLILSTIASAAVIVWAGELKFGIDLSGGVILVYEINEEKTLAVQAEGGGSAEKINTGNVVSALTKRVNPAGTKEVVIRPYGDQQIEIIIPEEERAEVEWIKERITTSGYLRFLIVADRDEHPVLWKLAENTKDKGEERVLDEETGKELGIWVKVGISNEDVPDEEPKYRVDTSNDNTRVNKITGNKEVLMVVEEDFKVEGGHLSVSYPGRDQNMRPCIKFAMGNEGSALMRGLTNRYRPTEDPERYYRLAIVMDDELYSAPRIMSVISDQGEITGDFSMKEVQFLVDVLKAGKLPAVLQEDPISENDVSAMLGWDTIVRGAIAIGISLGAVLIFMLIYYRFSGIVACLALATNLLLILALIIMFKAALTLPGLAGLVLTVGMSVDANVLIFERIREELARGSALRMALRNGFARATTTIVDANVTTLITAIVLYVIGTDQIRGFAITLILGILMSMYTAIFCARVIFDIAERKRWITRLGMMRLLGKTNIDFIGKRKVAAVVSLAIILIGLAGALYRGKDIFDIDFNGGTSVQIYFHEDHATPIGEVRSLLHGKLPDLSVTGMNVRDENNNVLRNQVYKVDTSITGFYQLGSIRITDRNGNSTTVDLSQAATREDLVAAINGAAEVDNVGVKADHNELRNGIVVTDETESEAGNFIIANADDKNTADWLNIAHDGPQTTVDSQGLPTATEVVEEILAKIFRDAEDTTMLVMHQMDISPVAAIDATVAAPAGGEEKTEVGREKREEGEEKSEEGMLPRQGAGEPKKDDQTRSDLPDDSFLAFVGDDITLLAQADEKKEPAELDADAPKAEEKNAAAEDEKTPAKDDKSPKAEDDKPAVEDDKPKAEEDKPAAEGDKPKTEEDKTGDGESAAEGNKPTEAPMRFEATLTFEDAVNSETLVKWVSKAAKECGVPLQVDPEQLSAKGWDGKSTRGFKEWTLQLPTDENETQAILGKVESAVENEPVWLSSNKIGSKVAGKMRNMALAALLTSLLGIVGYIWIRFQKVVFGLAAVVALVHDVLITLGALAVSYWLKDYLGFLQVQEFKISLPVVAAFLTIIGYSLNDTIVVFDRIREVRGKSPNLTDAIVNKSINQTLSRTLLTSLTTLLVVGILYFLGGQGIHSFAFCLVIGVMVGTYSSVFVASPFLLWMSGAHKKAPSTAS